MKKTFPSLLILFGVLLALFFLLADVIGPGKAGIQAAQILGMEIGVLFVVAGAVFNTLQKRSEFTFGMFWSSLQKALGDLPALIWVMLGALPAFILFFIVPAFFDPTLRIQYPVDYIRQIVPIGIDFQSMLSAVDIWLKGGQNTQVVFAPLVNVLFAPLLLIKYPASYCILTFITLASYLALSLLAALMIDGRNKPLIAFIAAISILSYGLMFELERGQTYTLSFALCLLAIYLFHWQRDLRWLAYLLFCISVQMKFYPALFVLLLVDDWRDWKNILLRFAGLGLANFLLLFIFGIPYFSAFLTHVTSSVQSGEVAVANHSIQSFVSMLSSSEWDLFRGESALWMEQNSGLLSSLLYIYFFVCFAVVLVGAWVRNRPGFDPDLLMVCVVGSLVLPSVNHDYTLPLLTAPFALAVAGWHVHDHSAPKTLTIILTLAASFAYSVVLIPHVFKPLYLGNSLPMLFIILTVVTLQNVTVGTSREAVSSLKGGVALGYSTPPS